MLIVTNNVLQLKKKNTHAKELQFYLKRLLVSSLMKLIYTTYFLIVFIATNDPITPRF